MFVLLRHYACGKSLFESGAALRTIDFGYAFGGLDGFLLIRDQKSGDAMINNFLIGAVSVGNHRRAAG